MMASKVTTVYQKILSPAIAGFALLFGVNSTAVAQQWADASMTVDVHLYKGPLSLHPEAQWGQLHGYIEESAISFAQFRRALLGVIFGRYAELKISDPAVLDWEKVSNSRNCSWTGATNTIAARRNALQKFADARETRKGLVNKNLKDLNVNTSIDIFHRMELWLQERKIKLDYKRIESDQNNKQQALHLLRLLDDILFAEDVIGNTRACAAKWNEQLAKQRFGATANAATAAEMRVRLVQVLTDMVKLGSQLKVRSAYWAFNQVQGPQPDPHLRAFNVGLQLLGAEYNRKITSAADSLLRQIQSSTGVDARELPLSTHLRDASPSAFINQIVWGETAFGPLPNEAGHDHYPIDRVFQLRQIYDDDSWAKINSVYASGRGEFSMALIKDDIGNWNLKNFESNPTELLQAYFDLGRAAVATATDIVQSVTGTDALPAAANAAKLASDLGTRFAFGNQGDGGTGDTVAAAKQVLIGQLEEIQQSASARTLEIGEGGKARTDLVVAIERAREDEALNKVAGGTCLSTQGSADELQRASLAASAKADLLNDDAVALEASRVNEKDELLLRAASFRMTAGELAQCAELRAETEQKMAALSAMEEELAALPSVTASRVRDLLSIYSAQLDGIAPSESKAPTTRNGLVIQRNPEITAASSEASE